MASEHPYRSINLGPNNPPFELRASIGKGWGAFATRKLAAGDLVFEESALFAILKPWERITGRDIEGGFSRLSLEAQQQVRHLRMNSGREFADRTELFHENEFLVRTEPRGHGFFIVLSRFNNSCVPDCVIPDERAEGNKLRMYASEVIMPGEELTFAYRRDFDTYTWLERMLSLGFICTCNACQLGTVFQRASGMRRVLIQGVQYIVDGNYTSP